MKKKCYKGGSLMNEEERISDRGYKRRKAEWRGPQDGWKGE